MSLNASAGSDKGRWDWSLAVTLTPFLLQSGILCFMYQAPYPLGSGRQLMREEANGSPDGGGNRPSHRVDGALTTPLGAVGAYPVATFRQDVVHLLRQVAEARHPVVDHVRVSEHVPVVDELLRQRSPEPHHRRAGVLSVDECRVDREADVTHSRQLVYMYLPGVLIHR